MFVRKRDEKVLTDVKEDTGNEECVAIELFRSRNKYFGMWNDDELEGALARLLYEQSVSSLTVHSEE